jgi:hypothetical protein
VKNAEIDKKNWDLSEAYKQKAKGFQELNRKYNALKNDKMKDQVIDAASDDAERVLHTVTGNRFINRLDARGPYASRYVTDFQGLPQAYGRPLSGSGSEEVGGIRGLRPRQGQMWNSQMQRSQGYTSREYSLKSNCTALMQIQRARLSTPLRPRTEPDYLWQIILIVARPPSLPMVEQDPSVSLLATFRATTSDLPFLVDTV